MANVNFFNVIEKDGQIPSVRFAAMTKQSGTFYKVADSGADVHYYLEDQLISADKAAEISVLDAAGVFDGANVEAVLKELYDNAVAKQVFLADESAGQSQYAKVYHIYQGDDPLDMTNNTSVGVINLPKDLVVRAGSVVEITWDATNSALMDGDEDVTDLIVPSGQTPSEDYAGKYIKLEIQNQDDPIYINVKDLIDIYTGGTTAEATVTIDEHNEITVTIVKISGTKIIYRAAGDVYTAVPATATYDSGATYYVLNAGTGEYEEDTTVTAANFDDKVAAGLYTKSTVTELTINAKVDAVEAALNALKTYVGTIPQTSSATDVIGYVDEKTQGGVASLNGEAAIASKSAANIVTIKGGVIEVEGIIENSASAAHATVVDGYYDNGKFYEEAAHTTEITPETTKSYKDLGDAATPIYNWTGKAFVLVRADVTLAKVAVTGAAEAVTYDNTTSGMTADDVQEAIDELVTRLTWVDV